MAATLPAWFQADRIFSGRNGWHIGSPSGLSVGPYASSEEAEAASAAVQSELLGAGTEDACAEVVRRFVQTQTRQIMETDPAARVIGVRVGERSRAWVRSSRYFQVGGVWFFHTREGVDVGPYGTERAVQEAAGRLIEMLREMAEEDDDARRDAVLRFLAGEW